MILAFVVSSILGWWVFDISSLRPLEEIALEQEEYRRRETQLVYKKRMVDRHLGLATSLLNVGQLDAATEEYGKVLDLDSNNVDAHLGKLKSEIFTPIASEVDREKALEFYRSALRASSKVAGPAGSRRRP